MNDIKYLKNHLVYIEKNKHFDIVDSIVGDMLMNKVKLVNKKLRVNINNKILNLIQEWYQIAINLYKIQNYPSSYINFTVYRGVYDMSEEEKTIIQPIPFSTSLKKSSCYDWIENRDNSFIMKIYVPINNLFTFIGNKNEGYEIILSAGFLKRRENLSTNFYNSKKIVEYYFESIDLSEMKNLIQKINS